MEEPMDDLLRELGQGAPFPVDWTEYEQSVMRRLFLQQALRRRRAWWSMVASGAVGSVATLVLAFSLVGRPSDASQPSVGEQRDRAPQQSEPPTDTQPVQEPVTVPAEPQSSGEFVRIFQREDGSLARMTMKENPFNPPVLPYSSRSQRANGSSSQIHFGGFSGADAAPPTAIGVVRRQTAGQ